MKGQALLCTWYHDYETVPAKLGTVVDSLARAEIDIMFMCMGVL